MLNLVVSILAAVQVNQASLPVVKAVGFGGTMGTRSLTRHASSSNEGAAYWYDPVCIDMPGIPQAGGYTDLTLKVDSKNQSDETDEGNNTHKQRITRQ